MKRWLREDTNSIQEGEGEKEEEDVVYRRGRIKETEADEPSQAFLGMGREEIKIARLGHTARKQSINPC